MVETRTPACPAIRIAFCSLGLACTGLGIAGLVLPALPGTVFLLIALWAFSRSSPRLHRWLYHHPRFGKTIRNWQRHGVIPLRAKILAIAAMSISFATILAFAQTSVAVDVLIGSVLATVAIWIGSRPDRVLVVTTATERTFRPTP